MHHSSFSFYEFNTLVEMSPKLITLYYCFCFMFLVVVVYSIFKMCFYFNIIYITLVFLFKNSIH